VDGTSGFSKLGEIQDTSEILRSVQIGNYVYSISTDNVKVVSFDDPTQIVAAVGLRRIPDGWKRRWLRGWLRRRRRRSGNESMRRSSSTKADPYFLIAA